jgi:hypothetical protein
MQRSNQAARQSRSLLAKFPNLKIEALKMSAQHAKHVHVSAIMRKAPSLSLDV